MTKYLLLAGLMSTISFASSAHTVSPHTNGDTLQLTQQSDHVVLGTVTEIQTEHTFADSDLLGRRHVVEVFVLVEPNTTLKTNKSEPMGSIRLPITSLSENQWQTIEPSFHAHFMNHQHLVFLKGDDLKPTTNYTFMQHPDLLQEVRVAIDETDGHMEASNS